MSTFIDFVSRLLLWLCGGSERPVQVTHISNLSYTNYEYNPESSVDSKNAETANGSGNHSVGSSACQPLHQHEVKYDIFINHRGPDTKLIFVTHLQKALSDKQYTPFFDKSVEEGKPAFQEIKLAIQDTLIHLAIFSPKYAESEYCLDELVEMLKCKGKIPPVTLLPIFFNVEPKYLRWPDTPGSPFREAFRKNKGRFSDERISRWKGALLAAASVKGFELANYAGDTNELKEEIVRRVEQTIRPRNSLGREQPILEPTVGLKEQRARILEQLADVGDTVAILGICGMGGIGKTTLAQEVYNHYSKNHAFRYYTFLNFGASKDVGQLQQQVLQDLLLKEEKNVVERYVAHFQELAGTRVLIVMDNISSYTDFKQLVPNMNLLGPGSRVVLTSRERDTLQSIMDEAPAIFYTKLHVMKELNQADSFQLFCLHAFRNKKPSEKADHDVFYPLALKVVALCQGLPLALKVIGQHLYRKRKEIWEEATTSMRSGDIIEVLSISYKGLEKSDKMMFLDVSCQMAGLLEEDAIDIWKSCGPCRGRNCMTSKAVHGSLQILKDKSLVEVDKDNRLTMHDLLREMGRKMVIEVNPSSVLPCHLWDPEEAKQTLDDDKERNEIRGLSLVGLQSEEAIDASTFQKMPEIHLLQLDGPRIEGDFSKVFKKIRWLRWRSSFLTNLPEQLWLQSLTILDLSNSSSITRLWSDGDTKAAPKLLSVLCLQNCTALEEIPDTIKHLKMLRSLNLQGCRSLEHLPDSLGELESLQDLNLNECENLESLPDVMVNLSKLKTFSMSGCRKITQLPADFGSLGALTIFAAPYWPQGPSSLTFLPDSFSRLSCLEELWLSDCHSLELPKSVKGLVKLRVLHLHKTGLTQLPDDFGDLESLVELHITENDSLQSLPESFGKLSLLKILSLEKCRKFRTLPSSFGQLQSLAYLNLECCPIQDGDLPLNFGSLRNLSTLLMQENKLTTMPDGFRYLTALVSLNMRGSSDLVNVDALPAFIGELDLGNCPKLIRVNLEEKQKKLKKLILNNCMGLLDVQGLEAMKDLQEINVSGCTGLSSINKNLVFLTTVVRECYLSGSGVCFKYNNDWVQDGAPNFQLVSYYDHAIGFTENTMTRKISSVQYANEVCVETTISLQDQAQVEAVVITVVAHDQGWSIFPHDHGQYNGSCFFEARIERADWGFPVFTNSLFSLRHADHRDQVYMCTLRKTHPLVEKLQDGDRICVIARSIYLEWRITVMQGSISVAYNKPDLGLNSDVFRDLYLKDNLSNRFRSNGRPLRFLQAFTLPIRVLPFSHASSGGLPTPNSHYIRVVGKPSSIQSNPKALALDVPVCIIFHRTCDICNTLITSQSGWHCNTCDDFDMCQTCYTNLENATQCELPLPHQSDHPMSVFNAPDPDRQTLIQMPYDDGEGHFGWENVVYGYRNELFQMLDDGEEPLVWGYVVYDDPNVRWMETFDLNW